MSAKSVLLEHLHRLMRAKKMVRPDGSWNIPALYKALGAKGSKRWLYRVVPGEADFGIAEYDRIVSGLTGLPFEAIAGFKSSDVPRDVADLYDKLTEAISNARQTDTVEHLRYAIHALVAKTVADLALQEKARPIPNEQGIARSPNEKRKRRSG